MINKLKKQIAVKIRDHSRQVSLTQADVAILTNTTQPRVSRVFNLRVEKMTLDSLFGMLQNLSIETTLTFE